MHALGRYIEAEMGTRGWERKDLINRSGLTKQHISQLLDPGRTSLGRMPDDKTVAGLSTAFGVAEEVIITRAAEAMGVPIDRLALVVVDPDSISNEALIKLIERRLLGGGPDGRLPEAEKTSGDRGADRESGEEGAQAPPDQRPDGVIGYGRPRRRNPSRREEDIQTN